MKQLATTLITMFFGSFLIVGILESYKNDTQLKDKIVETYFKPTTTSLNNCISLHNENINDYNNYIGSNYIVFNNMDKIIQNPSLLKKIDYTLWVTSMNKVNNENFQKYKKSLSTLKKCYENNLVNFEQLTIVTGTYNKFIKLAKEKNLEIQKLEKIYQEKEKKFNNNFDINKLLSKIDEFAKNDFQVTDELKYLIKDKKMLFELNHENLNKKKKILQIKRDLYITTKIESAKKINSMYNTSFIQWFTKIIGFTL